MGTDYPYASATAMAAEAEYARRTRRGRTGIGIGFLVIGAVAGFGIVWMYSKSGSLIDALSESERSEAVVYGALSVLFVLALLVAGIWNIAARSTNSLAPLIAALALSAIGLVFAVTNVLDAVMTTGRIPNAFALFLYLGIAVQTLRLLRRKPNVSAADAVP